MLGSGSLGQYALGEIPASPQTTPDIRPTAWPEPTQTLTRKVVIGATVAFISAGVFSQPPTPDPVFPPSPVALRITRAIPTQFAFNQTTSPPLRLFLPWSEPVRPRPALPAALQQSATQYTDVTPAPAAPLRLFSPWSEPQRPRPALLAAFQQSATLYTDATPIPPPTLSWLPPPSGPIRIVKAIPTQFAFNQTTSPPLRLFPPLSEPARPRPALPAALQQSATQYTDVTPVVSRPLPWLMTTGTVVTTKAIQAQFAFNAPQAEQSQQFFPWSEPGRSKLGLPAALQQSVAQYTTTPAAVTSSQQYPPWSEPARTRGLLAALRQSVAQYTATPVVVAVSQPYSPWSEPRRSNRGLQAFLQQSVVQYTTTTAAVPWLRPWTEPPRARKRPDTIQPTTVAPIAAPFFTGATPWQEPYRVKPVRPSPAQTFYGYAAAPSVSNFSQWYANFSEPQRQRVGLKTWLQTTTALTVTPMGIFATLAATETNSDQAEIVYIVSRAVASAKVSIVEGPQDAAATSLRES